MTVDKTKNHRLPASFDNTIPTMIRMYATVNSAHAKAYFTESLQPTNYYVSSQELQGRIYGLGAERLGILGTANRDTFFALCENQHPIAGGSLTPRTKDHRTVFYDISFHAPKSVSLLHCLSNDKHILHAFQNAVRNTMNEMQGDMLTRVRKNGKDENKQTGEMVIAEFIHQTARPSKLGISDPHLHCHNTVFNNTWDKEEGRFKAGNFQEIMRSLPMYQQRFHKRLADDLMGLGYKVRKTKSAFEVVGLPNHVLEHFSKRSSEIGQFAADHGITDERTLDQLGQRTRGKKQNDLTMDILKDEWRRQINEISVGKESQGDVIIRHQEKIISDKLEPQMAVDHAAKHVFERLSTIDERRLMENAYRFTVGNNSVSLDDLDKAFEADSSFIRVRKGFQTICTKKTVLAEEREMVTLARNGQNKFRPLFTELPDIALDGQQKTAVSNILTTPNMVSIVRGAAGAGKTTLLTELDKHLKAAGKDAVYVAPTAQAVREVLMKEGFVNSQTAARLMISKEVQSKIHNQILVVDEAGLIGTEDMRNLLDLTTKNNTRLVLVGDPLQHSSIARGDALKILIDVGKIRPAEVNKIRRQQNEKYRAAVQDLANGKVNAAFGKLDDIGSIRQIDPLNPTAELVADYVSATKKGATVLVVSPTHKQGDSITRDLRSELQKNGLLNKKEKQYTKLSSLNLTEAQKSDARSYNTGEVVQFDRDAPNIKRGSVWTVKDVNNQTVTIKDKQGKEASLPLDKPKAFSLYEKKDLNIAKGDKVRITKNGHDKNKKDLSNGQMFEVVSISTKGEIKCKNRDSKSTYVINSDYGHIDHAYCTTSHSVQGKTCDQALIFLNGTTLPAVDSKLFYVAASRGRFSATIYTDDKEQLLEYAERTGDRQSALELINHSRKNTREVRQVQNNGLSKTNQPIREIPKAKANRTYEP